MLKRKTWWRWVAWPCWGRCWRLRISVPFYLLNNPTVGRSLPVFSFNALLPVRLFYGPKYLLVEKDAKFGYLSSSPLSPSRFTRRAFGRSYLATVDSRTIIYESLRWRPLALLTSYFADADADEVGVLEWHRCLRTFLAPPLPWAANTVHVAADDDFHHFNADEDNLCHICYL